MAEYKIKLTKADEDILENDLTDIDSWIQSAVEGKINKCWLRMREEWTDRLMNDDSFTDPIPSNKEDFVKLILERSDYTKSKDRAAEMKVDNG